MSTPAPPHKATPLGRLGANKTPYHLMDPSADPVRHGSEPDQPPVNAYRGNRLELEPGMATNTGNGGISQTAPYWQAIYEKAAADAAELADQSTNDPDDGTG